MLLLKILSVSILTIIAIFTLAKEIYIDRKKGKKSLLCWFFIFLILISATFSVISLTKDYNEILALRKSEYLVTTMELMINLEFPTISENVDTGTMRIALGKYNVAALKTHAGSIYYFNSDETTSLITISKEKIKYTLLYKPPYDNNLLGIQIKDLEQIEYFLFNYSEYLSKYIARVSNSCQVQFKISLKINGINIGEKSVIQSFKLLNKGNYNVNVSTIFEQIEKKYIIKITS